MLSFNTNLKILFTMHIDLSNPFSFSNDSTKLNTQTIELYHLQLWNFFTEKNFDFYLNTYNELGKSFYQPSFYKSLTKIIIYPNDHNPSDELSTFVKLNLASFLKEQKRKNHIPSFESSLQFNHLDNLLIEFFFHFYKSNPEWREILFTIRYELLFDIDSKIDFFKNFIQFIVDNPSLMEDIINHSTFAFDVASPEEISFFLDQHNVSLTQKKNFFLLFYKKHQSILQNTFNIDNFKKSLMVKEFLLTLYEHNEDELKPYFSFFPALSNVFNPINLNFFIEQEPIIHSINIDCVGLSNSLALDSITYEQVKFYIKLYFNVWAQFLEYGKLDIYNKTSNHQIVIYFSHNNLMMNENIFKEQFLNFLSYFTQNYKDGINEESIMSWLLQDDFNKKLVDKTAVHSKHKL